MQTKLTVRVDQDLIQSAKHYAKQKGTTLSQLINDYLRAIAIAQDEARRETPVLQRLSGILPSDVSLEEYRTHLDEKYG